MFPTVDGKLIAGPTAHDQEDKDDWSVRPDAFGEIMPKAVAMLPALGGRGPDRELRRPAPRGSRLQLRDRRLARAARG